jgi:uncharacterized membrane protein YdbT with pleckstrin-like domain
MTDSYLNSLLGENEQILLVSRRHWLVLAGEILSESILTLAVIVLVTILVFLPPPVGNPLWALGYLLLAFPLVSLLRDVAIWASRKNVITSRRVIHLEGVLHKEITDSSLEKVNDVKMIQSFWGRVFGYGDIEILTASEMGVNKFAKIADPIGFKTAMLNAKSRLEAGDARGGEDLRQPRGYVPATQPTRPVQAAPAAEGRASGALLEAMQAQRAGPAATQPNAPAVAHAPGDIPALLRQLDELRQAGVLTEAEFQNKKAQLLARL